MGKCSRMAISSRFCFYLPEAALAFRIVYSDASERFGVSSGY